MMLMTIIVSSFLTFFTQLTTPTNINIDCHRYTNELEILGTFQYDRCHNNAAINSKNMTCAKVGANNHVTFLQIVNRNWIPPDISCFKHLVELRLINTTSFDIKSFPTSLIYLYISKTKMTYLSSDINRLFNLRNFEITKTDLQYIQEFTSGLSQLKFLTLTSNKLEEIPKSIKQLTSLIQLDVSNNPSLRSLDGVNNHPSLKILIAAFCSIKEIPKGLYKLERLRLNDNEIVSLNNIETLGRSTSEEKYFHFQNNQIEIISTEIRHIRNPYLINLNNNRIQSIPNDICQLDELKYLYISKNPFNHQQWPLLLKKLKHKDCLPNLNIL